MGSNMQRQALSLIKKETAIVETEIEKLIPRISFFTTYFYKSGIIRHIDNNKLILHENLNYKKNTKIFSKTLFNKTKSRIQKFSYTGYKQRIYKINACKKQINCNYYYEMRNKKRNEFIKTNENLTQGKSIKDNKLSVGKNLLIAYMIWKGYNFEDAIVINQRLYKNDTLSSFHLKKYKTFIINNKVGDARIKN